MTSKSEEQLAAEKAKAIEFLTKIGLMGQRFEHKAVDDDTHQRVISAIEVEGLQPFHSDASLHIWTDCYEIGTEYFRVQGEIWTHNIDTRIVERIIDTDPSKGPITMTYK